MVVESEKTRKPIDADLVYDLFKQVEKHLNSDWYNVGARIERGKMI